MSKKVSIKDVAKSVGVSAALVSYVMNGLEKEKRVGKEIAEKIRKAARELNYNPNQIARSLRKGSTKTIGLIVADIANPFFGHLIRIIEDEALKSGYTVICGSSDENLSKSSSLIDTLLYRQVDGFIIVPVEDEQDAINDLIVNGIPLVLMDRYFPELNVCHVCLNNYEATFNATNHLLRQGSERITIVAYESSLVHMKERIRGYEEAMKSNNKHSSIRIIKVPYLTSKIETQVNIEKNLKDVKSTDAIIFATNSLTLAGLYTLNKLSAKIPDELRIIGFDGNEAFDFFYAPLTYVEQPLYEIGVKSVNVLISLIEGSKEVSKLNLSHELCIRKSSE